jgi:hypothetical protein
MSGNWKEIVRLRFTGDRFRDHALDLRALGELSQFQKMVAETAKVLWRAANPDRDRLPKHFEERTRLCLRKIEDGSATAPLEVFIEEEEQGELFESEPVEANDAVALAYEVFEALEKNTVLPDRFSQSLVGEYEKLGQTLTDEEEIEITPPNRKPVHLTVVSRSRLSVFAQQGYEARVEVSGHVLEADVKRQRFQLWLNEKTQVIVRFTAGQEDEVTTALKEHQRLSLHIKGIGQHSATGELIKIEDIDEMSLAPETEQEFDASARRIEDVLQDLADKVPEKDWGTLPADLTDDLDHYLYGTPKK